MKISLAPIPPSLSELRPGITTPVFSDDVAWDARVPRRGKRIRAYTTGRRGTDQSCVEGQHFIRLSTPITPKELKILDREAKERGVSRAELVRSLIRELTVTI